MKENLKIFKDTYMGFFRDEKGSNIERAKKAAKKTARVAWNFKIKPGLDKFFDEKEKKDERPKQG